MQLRFNGSCRFQQVHGEDGFTDAMIQEAVPSFGEELRGISNSPLFDIQLAVKVTRIAAQEALVLL